MAAVSDLFALTNVRAVRALDSYDDCNFYVQCDDGAEYVFKLHNGVESARPAFIDAQVAALKLLAATVDANGFPVDARPAQRHGAFVARLLRFVPGELFCTVNEHTPGDTRIYAALGSLMGRVDRALATFEHAATHRVHLWDVRQFATVHGEFASCVDDAATRRAMDVALALFHTDVLARDAALRRSVVQNDANDRNVVVRASGMLALLDFGDMCHTWTVAEPAVALAYIVIGIYTFASPSPTQQQQQRGVDTWVAACAAFLRAYEAEYALSDEEKTALYALVCARVATSIAMGAYSASKAPANKAYLLLHARPAMRALESLVSMGAEAFNDKVVRSIIIV